jgi:transposase
MMGRLTAGQGQLFYAFHLDEVVPADHLVRRIDAVLDLGWIHKELAPFYSNTGRPSIDPELMIRMLLLGYVFAIRSERRICAEVQVNLAYRWFCGLSIEDTIPDHSVFSRARHERFRQSEVFRRVFERVVATCIAVDLVGGEAFSIDASLIKADVDQTRRMLGDAVAWPKPEETSRAIAEYLQRLDEARITEGGDHGDGDRKPPKQISLTDPQAVWVARKKRGPFFAYDANYLIDNKLGIIVDAEGTRANRRDETAITETMIARVAERHDLSPKRLAGDTAYGTGRLLRWLTDRNIAPHIPVWDKSQQTNGRFRRDDFSYDNERDVYICPGGKLLSSTGNVDQGRVLYYRASKSDCSACSLKPQCTTGSVRKVTRDVDEGLRDRVRALANTEAFHQSRRERKKVEMLFAHMKRILKLDRLRLRGLSGARDEVLLVATAQNLRRLAKYVGRSPPMAPAACAA